MKKVLVVDDEDDIRETIVDLLLSKNFEAEGAENASEALEIVKRSKPDIMLLDIMMPGMKASDLVEHIKNDENLKSIKIIYITAVQGAKDAAKDQQGIEATIEKPFRNDELISLLSKL